MRQLIGSKASPSISIVPCTNWFQICVILPKGIMPISMPSGVCIDQAMYSLTGKPIDGANKHINK